MSDGDDEQGTPTDDGEPTGEKAADQPAAEEAGAAESDLGDDGAPTAKEIADEVSEDTEEGGDDTADEPGGSEASGDADDPVADADDETQVEDDREIAADADAESTAPDEETADVGPDDEDDGDGDANATDESETDETSDESGENGGTDTSETDDEANEDDVDGADTGEESDDSDDAADDAEGSAEENATDATDETDDPPAQSLEERLADAEGSLDAAETESDLDDVEERLDAIEADLEAADLPEPDEDAEDEDAADPRADLESKLGELRDALEEARGPYAEDIVSAIESSKSTISDTRWTQRGEGEVADVVETFLGEAYGILDADPDLDGSDPDTADEGDDAGETAVTDGGEDSDDADEGDAESEAAVEEYEPVDVSVDRDLDSLTAALETVVADVESATLDPDDDEATIAALLDAVDALETGIEDAQAYDDLTVREKLAYEGFYDVLDSGNKKDFPPEWNAIKIYERQGEVEPILLAFDLLGSEFMEEHCIEAFGRLGAPEAFDVMHQRAQRRKKPPIEVLGKIGDERALDTLHPYIEGDSDPGLQQVTLKAIGEIGSRESTQHVADRLVAENEEIRSRAARALGLIGDTRAIRPLADVLRDDEADTVRASAAWALTQIGTEDALDAASEYAEDRSFLVQSEAEWAARALNNRGTDGTESEREQTA